MYGSVTTHRQPTEKVNFPSITFFQGPYKIHLVTLHLRIETEGRTGATVHYTWLSAESKQTETGAESTSLAVFVWRALSMVANLFCGFSAGLQLLQLRSLDRAVRDNRYWLSVFSRYPQLLLMERLERVQRRTMTQQEGNFKRCTSRELKESIRVTLQKIQYRFPLEVLDSRRRPV